MRMLSEKQAALAVKILTLLLIGAISVFPAASLLPESGFVRGSLESLEESSETVMEFSAATLAVSLAISALPDDFATPLADTLAGMNVYFVAILVVLFLEKLLLRYGMLAAFRILIPLACTLGILFCLSGWDALKGLAKRICVLALAMAFVVPCSTHLTGFAASEMNAYVEETIRETEGSAGKLEEAMEDGEENQTVFERLSELFRTAIQGISDLLDYLQDTVRKCMNAIAILILTNCLMPLLTLLFLKWILEQIFQIKPPSPEIRKRRETAPVPEAVPVKEAEAALAGTGGTPHEE